MGIRSLRLAVLACALCALGPATASAQTMRSCPHVQTIHNFLDCVEGIFSEKPVHLTLSSIPPGNGFPIGIVYENPTHHVGQAKSLVDPRIAFVGSSNLSWYLTGSLTWLPPLPYTHDRIDGQDCHRLGPFCTTEVIGLQLYATHRSLKSMAFYGLGPTSDSAVHHYHQVDNYGGVIFRLPMWNWVRAEASVEGRGTSLPTPADLTGVGFDEASAPGLTSTPAYIHSSVGVHTEAEGISEPITDPSSDASLNQPLMKRHIKFIFRNDAGYHWYDDHRNTGYGFRQFAFTGDESIAWGALLQRFVPPGSSTLVRLFCAGNKATDSCDFGTIHVRGLATFSDVASGHAIPFYLQPTIGGSDVESRVSLRGLDDMRFKDNNAVAGQIEYDRRVWDPLGVQVFYDVGTVASTVSALAISHAKHDIGFGVSLSLQGNIVAQAYWAVGAKPGWNWGYNFSKLF